MDKEKILSAAEGWRKDMSAFLQAMISHPSESCEEKEVVACIKAEMEKLGYDEVEVDGLRTSFIPRAGLPSPPWRSAPTCMARATLTASRPWRRSCWPRMPSTRTGAALRS